MNARLAIPWLSWRMRVALFAALPAILLGGIVLVGWSRDIDLFKSVIPGAVSMKANTAVGILLGGIALGLHALCGRNRICRGVASVIGMLVTLVGLATLAQYFTGADLGIDQLFFEESAGAPGTNFPGRMAPASALCFVLVGVSLGLKVVKGRFGLSHILAQMTLAFAAMTGVGYLVGSSMLIGIASYTQMAAHTALSFGFLGGGMLLLSEERSTESGALSPRNKNIRTILRLGTLGLTVTLIVVTFGYLIHERNHQDLHASFKRELESIVHYKAKQISGWVRQRLGDGLFARAC